MSSFPRGTAKQPRRARTAARFIVLTHDRCGSRLITGSLGLHPLVACISEPFNPDPERRATAYGTKERRYRDGEDIVAFTRDWLFSAPAHERIEAQGFKIFFNHCRSAASERPIWDALANDGELQVILLSRRNLAASYISRVRAMRADEWNLAPDEPLPASYYEPVTIDPQACLRHVARYDAGMEDAATRFRAQESIEVWYEDLISDFDGTLNRLWDFLGVERILLDPMVRHLRPKAYDALVRNAAELRAALASSSHRDRAWLPES